VARHRARRARVLSTGHPDGRARRRQSALLRVELRRQPDHVRGTGAVIRARPLQLLGPLRTRLLRARPRAPAAM